MEKKEKCGIAAIYSKKNHDVAPYLYRMLIALQHRGQDAAGMAVLHNGKIEVRKGLGLVGEVFKDEDVKMPGALGIGHTRYPTSGLITINEVQPFVDDDIASAHNGHIANYQLIKKEMEKEEKLGSTTDSEIFLRFLRDKNIEHSLKVVMEKVDGAYSNVAIIRGELVAFRDPHAIRPLVYGENEDFIAFASETTALDINNIPYVGDVGPGEYVVVRNNKPIRKKISPGEIRHCMFEYVYFARTDSAINNLGVQEARKRLGEELAREHPVRADVVVPIPDTARTAAAAFARASNMHVEEGLIKNRYIGRTFIMPSQEKRGEAVRLKLNPVRNVIKGKRVVLIDDSIVRGTTVREIVALVRNAGAKEVHLRIACPPIRAPCFYGVDMATYKELVANGRTIKEIRDFIGADSVEYISIEGLKKALALPLCTGCLNEDYITPYARKLAQERRDAEAQCG